MYYVSLIFDAFIIFNTDEESLRLLDAETRYLPLFSTLSSSPSRTLLTTASTEYRPTTTPPSVSKMDDDRVGLNVQQQLYCSDNVQPASISSSISNEQQTTAAPTVSCNYNNYVNLIFLLTFSFCARPSNIIIHLCFPIINFSSSL